MEPEQLPPDKQKNGAVAGAVAVPIQISHQTPPALILNQIKARFQGLTVIDELVADGITVVKFVAVTVKLPAVLKNSCTFCVPFANAVAGGMDAPVSDELN